MQEKQGENAQFTKCFEMSYPYYYVEYMPKKKVKMGNLQQVGSLSRITAFINACQRVKIMESLKGNETKVAFMDR